MAEKNTTIRGVINNVIHDLLPKTSIYNVMVDSTTTLAAKLAEVITSLNSKVTPAQLEEAIENLPPATADTIGGVKVGDGLNVDGDGVLGVVPEGSYELIERITLEEETAEIIRTAEPDGNAYNFSALMVTTLCPAQSDTQGKLYVYPGSRGRGEVSCGLPYKGGSPYATRSLFKLGMGVWDVYGYHGLSTDASTMVGQTSAQNLFTETNFISVNYLQIFTIGGSAVLPQGLRVEIWGVRADA